MKRDKNKTEQIKTDLIAEPEEQTPTDFVNSGLTVLNLAISDMHNGGYQLGKIHNLIGDSSAGKTMLALSMLAEAAQAPHLDNYRLVYRDVEHALEFNLDELFGKNLIDRIGSDADIQSVNTYEDFEKEFEAMAKEGPVIYVLDSLDAAKTEAEIKRRKKSKTDDSVGIGFSDKARKLSSYFSDATEWIHDSNSLLLIISQVRDSMNMYIDKARSGGHALKFYSATEIWLHHRRKMFKTISGKKHIIGNRVRLEIGKNKVTGYSCGSIPMIMRLGLGVDDFASAAIWHDNKEFTDTELDARAVELEANIKKTNKQLTKAWKKIKTGTQPTHRKKRYK